MLVFQACKGTEGPMVSSAVSVYSNALYKQDDTAAGKDGGLDLVSSKTVHMQGLPYWFCRVCMPCRGVLGKVGIPSWMGCMHLFKDAS